jgi:hypothetical protein
VTDCVIFQNGRKRLLEFKRSISKEVSVRVLKPRSGYVKGLGMRPSSFLKTTLSSTSNAYVRQLEECIVELQEASRRQEEERKKEKEERERKRRRG